MPIQAAPMDPAYIAAYNAAWNATHSVTAANAAGMASIGRGGQEANAYFSSLAPGEQGSTPLQPQTRRPQGGAGGTVADIIAAYRRGDYGAVGSAAARQGAIDAITDLFVAGGATAADAIKRATSEFNTVVPGSRGPGAGSSQIAMAGRGGEGVGSSLDRTSFQDWLAESEEGRRGLFGSAIRGQTPLANPFRSYLESRFEPTQAQYAIEAGLGSSSPGDFGEYATGRGQRQLSPASWRDYIQSASSLLTNPPSDMSAQEGDYRSWLDEDQRNQFDLALQSYLPGVAAPFRGAVKRRAGDVWSDLTIKQPDQSFLPWFANRGQRFF